MKPLLPLIITLIILLVPDLALAQNLPDVNKDGIFNGGGLIPCGQSADNTCNSCHVVILANTVVKWLIGITRAMSLRTADDVAGSKNTPPIRIEGR